MEPSSADIRKIAADVITRARAGNKRIALAESCTGGMVGAALTDIPGSSAVFDRGFVTYSNIAKEEMLGVSHESLFRFGAVSRPVALEMAWGALSRSAADIAVGITGIAGPESDDSHKPVGLVWFSLCEAGSAPEAKEIHFGKDKSRDEIRRQAVITALEYLACRL